MKKDLNASDVVVYTTIFGDIKDELRLPALQIDSEYKIDFFAFLEEEKVNNLVDPNINNWQIVPPYFKLTNFRRQARAHKVLAHELFPNCKYSLWIDGCLQLSYDNVVDLIKKYLQHSDICVFAHKKRNCIYDELYECIDKEKDDVKIMTDQVSRYFEEGYPKLNGLAETTAVLRRHSEEVKKFNQHWWQEIKNGSCRDQLSFDYVIWKLGMKYSTFPDTCSNSQYFKWFRH